MPLTYGSSLCGRRFKLYDLQTYLTFDNDIYIYMYVCMYVCIALHCIALHCIALHCIALQLHCIALHCIVLYCIVLYSWPLRQGFRGLGRS